MSKLDGYTIVFDLDGTLVDTAPDLIRATNHALASIDLGPADERKLRDSISFGARSMIVEALAFHRRVVAESEVDNLHQLFLAHYEANIAHSSRPYRDTVDTLQSLRQEGARLAVCTNKREPLARALLTALCIDHYFDAIAGLETFAVSKPHPGHIIGTVQLAGGDPGRAIMVGDSENDVLAARAAGIPVAGFLCGYSDTPMRELGPDAVFQHFFELAHVIDSLINRPKA